LEREESLKAHISKNFDELLNEHKQLQKECNATSDSYIHVKTQLECVTTKTEFASSEVQNLREILLKCEQTEISLQKQLRLKENEITQCLQQQEHQQYEFNKRIERLENDLNHCKNQLDEAVERAATEKSRVHCFEQEKKNMNNQVETLKESKKLLQRTMGEQLSALKLQLEGLKEERKRCDDAIKIVTVENERLQSICETEQKRNYELISK